MKIDPFAGSRNATWSGNEENFKQSLGISQRILTRVGAKAFDDVRRIESQPKDRAVGLQQWILVSATRLDYEDFRFAFQRFVVGNRSDHGILQVEQLVLGRNGVVVRTVAQDHNHQAVIVVQVFLLN
jgi:hypothetical protein